jgi:hypothetical protein
MLAAFVARGIFRELVIESSASAFGYLSPKRGETSICFREYHIDVSESLAALFSESIFLVLEKKTTTSAQIKFLKLHRNALGYSFLNSCKLIVTPCSIYWYQSYIDSQYGGARKPMAPSFRGSAKFCIEHQRAHFGLQLRRTPVADAYQQ